MNIKITLIYHLQPHVRDPGEPSTGQYLGHYSSFDHGLMLLKRPKKCG